MRLPILPPVKLPIINTNWGYKIVYTRLNALANELIELLNHLGQVEEVTPPNLQYLTEKLSEINASINATQGILNKQIAVNKRANY